MSRPPNRPSLLEDLLLLPESEQLRVLSSAGPIDRAVLAVVEEAGATASREAERPGKRGPFTWPCLEEPRVGRDVVPVWPSPLRPVTLAR